MKKGRAIRVAALERLSDRPGLTAPAFQSCLLQKEVLHATHSEGSVYSRHYRTEVAVETPLAPAREDDTAMCRLSFISISLIGTIVNEPKVPEPSFAGIGS